MKFKKILVTVLVIVGLAAISADAQIFSSGVTIVGSSNAPVLVSLSQITNSAYSPLQSRTLMIQNVVSNSIVTVTYGYQWAGLGGTNLYTMNSFTTNFNSAGVTNGSTVIIPIASVQNQVPIQPWGTYQATNLSGNVTNIVSFQ